MKILIIVRGLPGSGKTTFAESVFGKDNVYSADAYFEDLNGNYNFIPSQIQDAHRWCKEMVKFRMMEDTDKQESIIAVANTFTQEWEFEAYVNMAKECGYMVHSVVVENRHGGKNVHEVLDSKVQIMRDRFEIKL